MELFREVGGVHHQFLGNTATIDTGSPEPIIFGNAHFSAIFSGPASRRNAPGTCTNYK